MEQRNDEIDLLELSRNIMVRFYHYCQRRYKMLGIFMLIGAILGVVLYFKDKNKYENTIIGTSYVVDPLLVVDIINTLNDINQNNKGKIKEILLLGDKEALSLLSIKADTIGSIMTIDQEKLKKISVNVLYKNDLDIANFSQHLTQYIEANNFVSKELELEKNKSLKLIEKYESEIRKIDSLKQKIIDSKIETSTYQPGDFLVLNARNQDFLKNEGIELERELQLETKKLARLSGFSIIDERKGAKIKQVPLTKIILKMAAFLFAIGFIITIILEFNRQVKYIENSKS